MLEFKVSNRKGVVARAVALLAALSFFLTLFTGCDDSYSTLSREENHFVSLSDIGYVRGGRYIYKYDPLTQQSVINRKRKSYMLQHDNQQAFIHITFSTMPYEIVHSGNNGLIEMSIICNPGDGLSFQSEILQMVILKEKGMKYWLWNRKERVGVILDFEE